MTTKRADGEGSLYQLRDGRWVGSISLGFDPNGKRIRKTVTASKKAVAAKGLAQLKATYANTSIEARDYTVESWCNEWLQKLAPLTAAPHTVGGYRSNLQRHVYPRVGKIDLLRLSGKDVLDFQHQLLASKMKVASVKVARRPLNIALNAAIRLGLRDSNPLTAVPLPKETRSGPVGTRLTKQQAEELLAAARQGTPHVELFVLLGLTRGLRKGEICGLWWDDIDFDKKEIYVTHNLIESATYGIDGVSVTGLVRKDPKSFTSRRTLTLSVDLERAFSRVKARQARDRLKSRERWPTQPYVFTGSGGQPIWPRNMGRSYRGFLKANQLPNIGVHDLRRTFANTASQANAPIEQISEALGHASIGITKSLYIGQVPVLATRAFNAVDDYLNPAYPTPQIVRKS